VRLSQQHFVYDHRDRLTHAYTTGITTGAYDESDTYDTTGDLTNKGAWQRSSPVQERRTRMPRTPSVVMPTPTMPTVTPSPVGAGITLGTD